MINITKLIKQELAEQEFCHNALTDTVSDLTKEEAIKKINAHLYFIRGPSQTPGVASFTHRELTLPATTDC